MQLAQPLICEGDLHQFGEGGVEAGVLMAAEAPNRVFMSEGAAARRSTLTSHDWHPFRWLRHHDEAGSVSVTWAAIFPIHATNDFAVFKRSIRLRI